MRPIIAACLVLSAVVPAGALAPGGSAISIYGGGAVPGGSVGDSSKLGFSGGASWRHQFAGYVSGALDGEFMRFGDQDIAGGIRTGADAMSVGALLRLDGSGQGHPYRPYLAAGPTLNRVTRRTDGPGLDVHDSGWTGGFVVKAGALLALSQSADFGVSGRFRHFGTNGYAFAGGLEFSFNLAGSSR